MMLSNPIFGIGKGRFREEHGLVAHNSYVHIVGELGIPGYSLWGGALIFTALVGYHIIKYRNKEKLERQAAILTTQKASLVNSQNTRKAKKDRQEQENKVITLNTEYALNQTLFFSLVGFMVTAFFISRSYTLLLFIFIGMSLASHIRLVKLVPKLEQFFSANIAIRSMLYCWVIIVAVYITLKMGL